MHARQVLYYGLCASHPYRWGLCSVWMASLNSPFSSLCLLGAQVTNVCYMYVAFILLTLITMPLCFCYVLCLILFIHQPEHCLKTGGKSSLVWIRFYIFAILEIGTQAYKFYVCGFVCVCVSLCCCNWTEYLMWGIFYFSVICSVLYLMVLWNAFFFLYGSFFSFGFSRQGFSVWKS